MISLRSLLIADQSVCPEAFYLTNVECEEFQDHLQASIFLNSKISSFNKKNYLNKKTILIEQAKKAIQFSHTICSSQLLQICNPGREGKLLSKSIGVYKKQRSCEREAIVWELSVMIGCDHFIVPSIPIHIYGELATFQPFIPDLKTFGRFLHQSFPTKISISQSDFWKLAIFCFLIGHSDLNGQNLQHNDNEFILVDNDWSFPDRNNPFYYERRLDVPLVNSLIDLDRANIPIDTADCNEINSFLESLKLLKPDLADYFFLSPLCATLSESSINAFWERYEKITQYPIECQMTLYQLAKLQFPKYFEIFEGISPLLKEMTGTDWGPFSLLHMIGPCLWWMGEFSFNQKEQIYQWLGSKYAHAAP